MSTPAMIYLALTAFGLGISISKDGQPKTGKYSFWVQASASAIVCALLYWGGFFSGGVQ